MTQGLFQREHALRSTFALAAVLALSGCLTTGDSGGESRILGLSQGDGMTFGMTADGKTLSILYDRAVLDSPPASAGHKTGDLLTLSAGFALKTAGPPARARFWIRGFTTGAAEGANLTIESRGSRVADLTPQLGEGNFTACFDALLNKPQMPFQWTATARIPPDRTIGFHVDSIDLNVLPKGAPPLEKGACPEVPKVAGHTVLSGHHSPLATS